MFLYPNPDLASKDTWPKTVQYVETKAARETLTDIYYVNGDPSRWLHVSKPLFGIGGLMIKMWGQPRRMWDGAGDEYHEKGYRGPPPPMSDEQREALALLFKLLNIKPECRKSSASPAGEWQI